MASSFILPFSCDYVYFLVSMYVCPIIKFTFAFVLFKMLYMGLIKEVLGYVFMLITE